MNFKTFMTRTGETQMSLADRFKIKQPTVSSWVSNRTTPPISVIKQLILMGMTIAEVFDAETEAFVFRNASSDHNQLSADIVETGLSAIVSGDTKKFHDPKLCAEIVELGLKEIFKRNK